MNAFGWLAEEGAWSDWTLWLLAALILMAFYTDVRRSIIPNRLTIPFVLLGLIAQTLTNGLDGLGEAALGTVVGLIVVGIIYLLKGVGAGDVKLFAAIGSIAGWQPALFILLYAVLLSGLIGAVLLVVRHVRWRTMISWLRWGLLGMDGVQGLRKLSLTVRGREGESSVVGVEQEPSLGHRSEPVRFPFMLAVLPAVVLMLGVLYV